MTVTLADLKARARDLRPLLEAVGQLMVGRIQSAFRDQSRGGKAWAPRAVPNRVGILEDLRAGRTPPDRRFEPRPAGIDTGRLRSSIAYRVAGRDSVEVGSSVSYASDVQRGATKQVTVPRRELAAWLRSLPREQRRAMRRKFGYLFHLGVLTITTPPRPFVLVTDEDRQKIRDLARQYFAGGGAR